MIMNSATGVLEQRFHPGPGAKPAAILEDHPTQSATAIDGWRSALFGIPFLAVGVFVSLVAHGFLSGRKHAPDWVIGVLGAMFFFGGLFFLIHGLLGAGRQSRYLSAAVQRPSQPWLYDFHWSQEGIASRPSTPCFDACLAPFFWPGCLFPSFCIGL